MLSRQKRQDLLFGGGGLLKDIFGIAYTTDVHGLNGRIAEAESRLNIQVKTNDDGGPRRFIIALVNVTARLTAQTCPLLQFPSIKTPLCHHR